MPFSSRFFVALLPAGNLRISFLLIAVAFNAVCVPGEARAGHSQSLSRDESPAVDRALRAFMKTVAHSVTQDGPLAWIKYFDASPAFFMVVNGQMAFQNADAAKDGTRKFAQTIRQIELKWGDDLRVDPITNDFAVVAVSWREIQVDNTGRSVTETGYFTGLAEYREGHWQFRNAHWSAPVLSQ
jgi:hypothetical protein